MVTSAYQLIIKLFEKDKMAEFFSRRSCPPPTPPPRTSENPPGNVDNDIYEEVNGIEQHGQSQYSYVNPDQSTIGPGEHPEQYDVLQLGHHDANRSENRENEAYNVHRQQGSYVNEEYIIDLNQLARDRQGGYDYSNEYQGLSHDEIIKKTDRFKRMPKTFIEVFESTHDELRTDEETFIITNLLKPNSNHSPILNGKLDQLALLASCNSPHVVKRALDALLNEIFLSISHFPRIRFCKILEAEKILRESFSKFFEFEHLKAKCQRMTTYAWLITLVLLKCDKEDFIEIIPEIQCFDRTLDGLQNDRDNSARSTFRYAIYLSRESIKRIVQSCQGKDSRESLIRNMNRCAHLLNSKLEKSEVMKLGRALSSGVSWQDIHVCLVFLQDLPKFHQFQDNNKPIVLMQMMIADFRERQYTGNRIKTLLKRSNYEWQLEVLVYHLMLRLIRTSRSTAIIDQVLTCEQGCGGIFRSWNEVRSNETKEEQPVVKHLKELCQRVVFFAAANNFKQFVENTCQNNEKQFIEHLSILHLSSIYREKIFEISPASLVPVLQNRVRIHDALINGRKCLLKLRQHSKEEVLKRESPKGVQLRKEIEIVRVLNAVAEPCQNVVELLGSSIEAPMHMIIERTPKGDLLTYLQGFAKSPEMVDLIQMAVDICNAMIYLGTQNITHRDLRAKNCFVFAKGERLLTKLGDFHLAVLSYTGPTTPSGINHRRANSVTSQVNDELTHEFAVRWTAVEALQFGEFSTASDVWSYGVLLFEIFTFGCTPYVNMPSGLTLDSDEDVRKFVLSGNRLEVHPLIPQLIQDLIQSTMVDADHRPCFLGLKDSLCEVNNVNETYTDPAFFGVSHNISGKTRSPINSRTGCSPNGCFGECLKASDIAERINVDDSSSHFIKEFVAASSTDVRKISELKFSSLAVITNKIFHDEKVELITEVGDLGNVEEFISTFGCPIPNALIYLSQTAEAVSFLHERRFIHRNLRATSVFICSDGQAKLACLARVRKLMPDPADHSSTIPITLSMPGDSMRWSSPEVIKNGIYSKTSDVWAFGVLIWEVFSFIESESNEGDNEISTTPYQHLASKQQILSYLQREKRLLQPKDCPDSLYDMMIQVWEFDTENRLLKIQDIVQHLKEHP